MQVFEHLTFLLTELFHFGSEDDYHSGSRNVSHQQVFLKTTFTRTITLNMTDTPGFKPFSKNCVSLPNGCHGNESPPETLKYTATKGFWELLSVVFSLL